MMGRRKKTRIVEDGYKSYLYQGSESDVPRTTRFRHEKALSTGCPLSSTIQPSRSKVALESSSSSTSSGSSSSITADLPLSQCQSAFTSTHLTAVGSQHSVDSNLVEGRSSSSITADLPLSQCQSAFTSTHLTAVGSQHSVDSNLVEGGLTAETDSISEHQSNGLSSDGVVEGPDPSDPSSSDSSDSTDSGDSTSDSENSNDPVDSSSDGENSDSSNNDFPEDSDDDKHSEDSDDSESSDRDADELNAWANLCKEDNELKVAKFMKNKYHLDKPLMPNLSISKFDTLLLLFEFSMHHGLSNVGLLDLFKMINTIFNAQVIPESLFIYERIFQGDLQVKYHFFCKECSNYIGEYQDLKKRKVVSQVCDVCGVTCQISKSNQGNFFITVPMRDQIKNYLESVDGMDGYLQERNVGNNGGHISDIMDGEVYRSLRKNGDIGDEDITLTCSTDGAAIFLSEHNTMWPIQFRINELPPDLRNSANNMFIAGLWFGDKDPKMQVFLKAFAEESCDLYQKKIEWMCKEKCMKSRVLVLNCCLDSVAKPHVQGCMMFNSKMGCMYCFHPTHPTAVGRRYGVRDDQDLETPTEDQFFEERADQDMLEDMVKADAQPDHPVRGVKGFTPFIVIPHFHIVFGFTIDYMHGVLLGVTRQLARLWFREKFHNEPHYIKQRMAQIDARLLRLKPPSNISRRPRSIVKYKKYKASEWRSWLLFYSLPCLKDILPNVYYKHFILLVTAIFIMLQSSITIEELDEADRFLKQFIVDFEILYTREQMTYNVHLLSHIVRCVRLWGPLWTYSAFAFETGIGALKVLVKGTTNVLSQITSKYVRKKTVHKVKQLYNVNPNVSEFIDSLAAVHRVYEAEYCDDGTVLLGSSICSPVTDDEELEALMAFGIVEPSEECYERMILKNVKYHSTMYKKSKKADDSTVLLVGGSYAKIQRIFVQERDVQLLVRLMNVTRDSISSHCMGACAPHIKVCERYAFGNLAIVKPADIVRKSIFLQPSAGMIYITDFPNVYEKD